MTMSPPKNLAPFVENPPLPIPKPAPKHPEKNPAPVQSVPVNNAGEFFNCFLYFLITIVRNILILIFHPF